jgi:SAM-dependent methyltransferase
VSKSSVTDDDLRRLEAERAEADRRYNEALTRVDRALVHPEPLAEATALPATPTLPHLNQLWEIVTPTPAGWRGRLASLARRVVGPIAERQQAFNAALVQHLNERAADDHRARAASSAAIEAVRHEFEALERFQSELIQFLQHVTPLVDTKFRREAGVLRRQFEEQVIGLTAGLDAVTDHALRRWESMLAREQRFAAKVETIASAQDELRVKVAGFQQVSQGLKRELERLSASGAPGPGDPAASPAPPPSVGSRPETLGTWLDSGKYVGFEDGFRGSTEDIRARVLDYVSLFEGASDVLDVGCGRGEFLEVLAEHGIRARGVDVNHAMVDLCRLRGLDVREGDGVRYLEGQPDGSLGGLLAIQVVEHLHADQLVRLLELAYLKLKPGSRIALETINPACWYAFFASYIRDITHVHPIHPDTLQYLLVASGFQRVEIRYRQPYPERNKLQKVPAAALARVDPVVGEAAETVNQNVTRLNALLFTDLDFAAIGEKP